MTKIKNTSGVPYQIFRFKVSDVASVRVDFLDRFIHLGEETVLTWRGEWTMGTESVEAHMIYEIDVNATKYNRETPQTHIAKFLLAMLGSFNDPNIEYIK